MFIDEVQLTCCAGKGGDGLVSWRREKFIPKGGPYGGNGGDGGSIILSTTSNVHTLTNFRHKKTLQAPPGERGGINVMQGAKGEDLIVHIPVGTLVKDALSGEVIIDMDKNGMQYLLCQGGRGGYGNAHFATSTRQAPAFAELGDIGEEKQVIFELKLVADIGIIGIPSAGKSTLISVITNTKPKIGDYPFTTLTPNLGVLEHRGKSLVIEDVPGLIPGASQGKGLGIEFLKHIERTKVLLHLLDLYRLDEALQDYKDIRYELEQFSKQTAQKQEIVVFSKGDLLDDELKSHIVSEFQVLYPDVKVFVISSATGEGIEVLKDYLIQNFTTSVLGAGDITHTPEMKVIDLRTQDNPKDTQITYMGEYVFQVKGKRIEQIVRMTPFDNLEAVARVYDVLEKIGVIKKIEAQLEEIFAKENIDNTFFFEGTEGDNITPKIQIGSQEILLEKMKYKW